jgi:hypothetical protein
VTTDPLLDFRAFPFAHQGRERTVYRKGEGPAVIVMHEVPGISIEVIRFARKVVDAGFTVFMPHLFGIFGIETNQANRMRELAKLCVSREWHVLAENRSSPIADWLRALAAHVHEEIGGAGVGAVGMCVTGNFALTMTLDPWVVAPVLAHPSFPLPLTPKKAAALHVTPETLDNARRRIREEGMKVLGVASPATSSSAAPLGSRRCGGNWATASRKSRCRADRPSRTRSRRTACSPSGWWTRQANPLVRLWTGLSTFCGSDCAQPERLRIRALPRAGGEAALVASRSQYKK